MHQNAPFLSRVSMTMHDEHDMVFFNNSVCLSVRLSVCPIPVLCQNERTHRHPLASFM